MRTFRQPERGRRPMRRVSSRRASRAVHARGADRGLRPNSGFDRGENAARAAPLGIAAPVAAPGADLEHRLSGEVDPVERVRERAPNRAMKGDVGCVRARPRTGRKIELVMPADCIDAALIAGRLAHVDFETASSARLTRLNTACVIIDAVCEPLQYLCSLAAPLQSRSSHPPKFLDWVRARHRRCVLDRCDRRALTRRDRARDVRPESCVAE